MISVLFRLKLRPGIQNTCFLLANWEFRKDGIARAQPSIQPTYPTFVLGFPSVAFKCIYVGQIVYQAVHLLNPTVAHCICIFINCQCIYQIKGFIFQPYLGYLRHEKMMIIIIFIIYKLSLYLYLKLQICIFRCTVWTRESVWNTEYMG